MLNDIGFATHMWKYHKRGPSTPTSTDIYIYICIYTYTHNSFYIFHISGHFLLVKNRMPTCSVISHKILITFENMKI